MKARGLTMLAALVVGVAGLSGCQTWDAQTGLTLPSPDYLRHYPTYIPQSPDFPLQKELNSIREASDALQRGR